MTEDPFVAHRSLLFTVAYEMLGSAADADDVVQETWLRWADVDQTAVLDPRAYLVRIVTRQALNRLRTLARRREDYVGEWLPEPLLTSPDVAEDVELAESVSIAMLTVLETLGPTERAVLVLHEVFDVPYDEIAEAVGKSPAAVRQIAHRAREHVAARRPRMAVSRTEQQQVVERFLAALTAGDLQGLLDVLAPDVVVVADGGGLAPAARRPVSGRNRVANALARFAVLVPRRGDHDAAGQRRRRRADRPGRRVRHGDHLRRRGRPDHPHLRDAQPAQAGPARRGGRAAPLTDRKPERTQIERLFSSAMSLIRGFGSASASSWTRLRTAAPLRGETERTANLRTAGSASPSSPRRTWSDTSAGRLPAAVAAATRTSRRGIDAAASIA